MINFDFTGTDPFIDKTMWDGYVRRAHAAHKALQTKSGAGNEWLGWRDMLANPNDALIENISALGEEITQQADVLLCIGIGGSFLGADAIIQALSPYFPPNQSEDGPKQVAVIFAGHHLSSAYLNELLHHLTGKSVYVNVISKSGTTLEPAVTFRIVREWMEATFEDHHKRIIATIDESSGALRTLAEEKGYRTYVIPGDVGGRFSVLTPVGLLPIAAAGYDIRSLFYGAVSMMKELENPENNPAIDYAMRRYMLHEQGFATEVLSVFEPKLKGIGAWWQQLFGESEGKDLKGLFPALCTFTTDLHSLGQYLQAGKRNLLETFLVVEKEKNVVLVPNDASNLDGLNYLADQPMHKIGAAAYEGTAKAHSQGGVPTIHIRLSTISEETLGQLIYFYEHAVSIGGYLLGVNPFDQPGVEAYKQEMFKLLGRP